MENVILGKYLNLDTTSFLFHAFTLKFFFHCVIFKGNCIIAYFNDCKRHSFYYFDFGNVVSLFNISEPIFIWGITFWCN